MGGEIYVGSDIPKHKLCTVCESKDRILKVEIGDGGGSHSSFLCNRCSRELWAQLDIMMED